jgi:PAS domain S-box-containing protein
MPTERPTGHAAVELDQLRAEVEALRASEAKLRRIIDAIPGVVYQYRVDADGNESFPFLSARADALRGGPSAEELRADGSLLWQMVLPEDIPALQESIRRSGEERTPWVHEYRVRTSEGEVRWLRGSSIPEEPADDGAVTWNGIIFDITGRKRVEEALRESQARLLAAVESLPFDFWACDADGRYVMQNTASLLNWGDYIGMKPEELDLPWEIVSRWTGNNRRALAGEIVSGDVTYTVGGERRHYHQVLAPIHDGMTIRGLLGVNIDITERVRAEKALSESESRLERAEALSLVMTAHVALDGTFLKVPASLCEMLGYSCEELLAMRSHDVTHPDDVEIDWAQCRRLVRGEIASFDLEKRFVHRDGGVVWVYINTSIVTSEAGEPLYFLSYIHDITKSKRLEEQLLQSQKLEAVGRLAGGVAHDFNNVLTAVLGFVSVASKSLPADSPVQAHLRAIRVGAERGGALTTQLLAFARKQVIEPRAVDLNELLGRVESLLRRVIGEDVELETRLASDLWSVRADPGQLEQVLMNLAVNARDAMPGGGRLLIETANVAADDEAGERVLVRVTDTGVGMSEETLEHIFEPFYTTKESGKGTGLGLATCYGIVTQSGGSITVTSAPGRGATFEVMLLRADEPAAGEPSLPPVSPTSGGERILVVEDEPLVRNIIVLTLQSLGYEVVDASNGEEALRVAKGCGRVDLLVTDVVMPQMGGRQLAERLRATEPGLAILYVSGYTEDALVRSEISVEGTAFLQKPFSPDTLARRVREVLDARRTAW